MGGDTESLLIVSSSGLGPPSLLQRDGGESAVRALTEFMTASCFVYRNQSRTIRRYVVAIKDFHKMFAGWEQLSTIRCVHGLSGGKGDRQDTRRARRETQGEEAADVGNGKDRESGS